MSRHLLCNISLSLSLLLYHFHIFYRCSLPTSFWCTHFDSTLIFHPSFLSIFSVTSLLPKPVTAWSHYLNRREERELLRPSSTNFFFLTHHFLPFARREEGNASPSQDTTSSFLSPSLKHLSKPHVFITVPLLYPFSLSPIPPSLIIISFSPFLLWLLWWWSSLLLVCTLFSALIFSTMFFNLSRCTTCK